MSHSKLTKRGYSIWIERWNKSAKKYINTCSICGKQGYSPVIEAEGFCDSAENRVNFKELTKTLSRLEVDVHGRCTDCARIQDGIINSKE